MIKRWTVSYPGATGYQRRRCYVYLPVDYDLDPERRYPVLYMFDGQNLFFNKDATFGKSWGLGRCLDRMHAPLIVAALECNPDPDNARLSEYCPFDWTDSQLGPFKGRGEQTMKWFINRFKPYIDSHFRTIPFREYTFIGGSSMGGLMALYAVTRHNEIFGRAASFSPTLDADVDKLSGIINESEIDPNTLVYMDYGAEEFRYEPFQIANFIRISSDLLHKEVMLQSRIAPRGTHTEASWEKQLPFAIKSLLYEVG